MTYTPSRRRAIAATVTAILAIAATPCMAQADYPNQPIRLIVPYPAGGATDALARVLGQKLQEDWKQNVIVENKPGASGVLGNSFVVKAAPDGYTVLVGISSMIQQRTLMTLPYDPFKDLQPITRIAYGPAVFAVPKDSPANSLKEYVALVKANPGKYNYGSYGLGSLAHLQGALLSQQTGLDMVHIPYQGGAPLIVAMQGGQLTSAFLDVGFARPSLDKFKLLGVTGAQRLPWLPQVPTFKEQGFDSFEPVGWIGLFLPAGTPKPIVDKFTAEVRRILRQPDVRERIEALGLTVGDDTPAQFAEILRQDDAIYARIVRDAAIKLN